MSSRIRIRNRRPQGSLGQSAPTSELQWIQPPPTEQELETMREVLQWARARGPGKISLTHTPSRQT